MADTEILLVIEGRHPETAAGLIGAVMRLASGQSKDTQWFDYRPSFNQEIVRVEWDRDTMQVVLPADVSEYLIRHGYARFMTDEEARDYNSELETTLAEPAPAEAPPPKQAEKRHHQERKSS